jgi:hypothetical protein
MWAALKPLQRQVTRHAIIDAVTSVARHVLFSEAAKQRNPRPSAPVLRCELTRLANEGRNFAAAWDRLSVEGRQLLTTQIKTLSQPPPPMAVFEMTQLAVALELLLAPIVNAAEILAESLEVEGQGFYQQRGQRRQEALVEFGFALASIYRKATGKEPTWTYDPEQERVTSPFRAFTQAAIAPTGLLRSRANASQPNVDDLFRRRVLPQFRSEHRRAQPPSEALGRARDAVALQLRHTPEVFEPLMPVLKALQSRLPTNTD